MITATQARQYLDQMLGVGAPDFLIAAAVESVGSVESAMVSAGYSNAQMIGIQCIAVALIVAAGDPRRLSNQGSPSGASRAFRYAADDLSRLRRSLAALDTAGTVSTLVGPDPAGASLLMVVC